MTRIWNKHKQTNTPLKRKVFVAMSGGVDSSVAAALLKKDGHNVMGVFIKTWHPEFLPCTWKEERLDAMRVAAHLDIPFLTFDFEKEYKRDVADYFIAEYKAGRTPNPDVMCNKEIKFGAFLKKAREMGADFIATGHYAQTQKVKSKTQNKIQFLRAKDKNKDQTYFLWTLTQEQLRSVLFPVGGYEKDDVRKLAKKFGLPTAEKKDSQGICFLGDIDMKEFLSRYIKQNKGDILNEKGEKIGIHDGAVFYTLGQRHGFIVTATDNHTRPYYVVKKDLENNIITVSRDTHTAELSYARKEINLENINWISDATPNAEKLYTAQIRYRGAFLPCRLAATAQGGTEDDTKRLIFDESQLVAVGQSIVLYDGEICLGGGVVK